MDRFFWKAQITVSDRLQRGTVSAVEFAQVSGRYSFKGVATGTGIVDRMKRVFLPGVFDKIPAQVPLLAFHDDTRPVGVSHLKKKGTLVMHQSELANVDYAHELEELIKAGAIPATSIGWFSDEMYWGFSDLEKSRPDLVKKIEAANIEKSDRIIYYAHAEIMENSVTPVPANPLALIAVASMFGEREQGMISSMLEMTQAKVPESSPVQKAHDTLVEAGAVCSQEAQTDPHVSELMEILEESEVPEFWARVTEIVKAAQWTTEYINSLPDSAFAYIEPGGKKEDGKTTPRSLRHFPHHSDSGSPDEAHVRNALARIPQSSVSAEGKSTALAHVQAHAKKLGIGEDSSEGEESAVGDKHTHAKVGGGSMTHSHEGAGPGHKHPGLLPLPKGKSDLETEEEEEEEKGEETSDSVTGDLEEIKQSLETDLADLESALIN